MCPGSRPFLLSFLVAAVSLSVAVPIHTADALMSECCQIEQKAVILCLFEVVLQKGRRRRLLPAYLA